MLLLQLLLLHCGNHQLLRLQLPLVHRALLLLSGYLLSILGNFVLLLLPCVRQMLLLLFNMHFLLLLLINMHFLLLQYLCGHLLLLLDHHSQLLLLDQGALDPDLTNGVLIATDMGY